MPVFLRCKPFSYARAGDCKGTRGKRRSGGRVQMGRRLARRQAKPDAGLFNRRGRAWRVGGFFFLCGRKARILRGAGHADMGKHRNFFEISCFTLRLFVTRRNFSPLMTHSPPWSKNFKAGDVTPAEGQPFTAWDLQTIRGGLLPHYSKYIFHYSLNKITVREPSRGRIMEEFFTITAITGITEKR